MQNLIVGERYYLIHPTGYWQGEATIVGYTDNGDIKIKDVEVFGENKVEVEEYFKEEKGALNGQSEWSPKLVDFNLENE